MSDSQQLKKFKPGLVIAAGGALLFVGGLVLFAASASLWALSHQINLGVPVGAAVLAAGVGNLLLGSAIAWCRGPDKSLAHVRSTFSSLFRH